MKFMPLPKGSVACLLPLRPPAYPYRITKRLAHLLGFFLFPAFFLSACSIVDYVSRNTLKRCIASGMFDAVIIPGNAFDSAGANRIFKARMYWAKHLYDQGIARNIIFSGAAVHTPFIEGATMKIIADSLGIPRQHTFFETRAEHSTENIDYGLQLADSLGFKRVAVATDPFQAMYIRLYLRHQNLNVGVLAFELESMAEYNKPLPVIDTREVYVAGFVPLKYREEARALNNY